MNISDRQFGTMAKRMRTKGGFTFDPHTKRYARSGIAVGEYPEAELKLRPEQSTAASLKSYAAGAGPTFARDPLSHIGGWAPGGRRKDVYDISRVYPATSEGHAASRQAQLRTNQEASFHLASYHTEYNPYHVKNRVGDIVAHDSPTERQIWAEMPVRSPVTKGRKIRLRGEGQSFS